MKKLIAMAVAAVVMASSTFALGLSVGGKALGGVNVIDGFEAAGANLKQNKAIDFGGGGYVNLNLLGMLGVQAEVNFIGSQLSFSDGVNQQNYDTFLMDIPLMVWFESNLWKFSLGVGGGVNFSMELASMSDLKTATKDSFTMGAVFGADVKFFFSERLGLVLGARYIMNFQPKEANVGDTSITYNTVEFSRQTLYGTLGLEFKLF